MKVIAFDLDGIFVPDIEGFTGTADELEIRSRMVPLFIPDFPFLIITGRPSQDLPYTKDWINRFFKKDTLLFHGNETIGTESSALYKAKVLNELGDSVLYYVESDIKQVNIIKQYTETKILLGSDYFNYESLPRI